MAKARVVRTVPLPSPTAAALGAGLVALAALGTGCFGDSMIKPKVEIYESTVAVIPFDDPSWSGTGPAYHSIEISREVAIDLASNGDLEVKDPRDVEAFFETRNITEMSPQAIGLALGVDYVIFGEILQYDTRGATIGMNQGVLRARVRLQDVVNDDVPLVEDVSVRYPSAEIMGFEESQIERGLIRKAGEAIGRLFYEHEPPEREKMELPK